MLSLGAPIRFAEVFKPVRCAFLGKINFQTAARREAPRGGRGDGNRPPFLPPAVGETLEIGRFSKKSACIKKLTMLNIGSHVNVHSKVSSSGSLFLLGNGKNGKG